MRRGQSEVAGGCAAGWMDGWTPPIDPSLMWAARLRWRAGSGLRWLVTIVRRECVCALIRALFWSVFFDLHVFWRKYLLSSTAVNYKCIFDRRTSHVVPRARGVHTHVTPSTFSTFDERGSRCPRPRWLLVGWLFLIRYYPALTHTTRHTVEKRKTQRRQQRRWS